MLRGVIRLGLVVVLLVGAVMFFTGYWAGSRSGTMRDDDVVGTAGRPEPIDEGAARQRGARVGEAVADTANKVGTAASAAAERSKDALDDGAITTRIKAKMALDELVRALEIDVDTVDGVVTLRGRVESDVARQRALQLAKETSGVRSVKDELSVR